MLYEYDAASSRSQWDDCSHMLTNIFFLILRENKLQYIFISTDNGTIRLSDNPFHIAGPATEKARRP